MDLVLMQAVQMLWQGMLGVFVVIGLIALVVAALTRLTQK
ncbi:MAG: sodium pump decarboxylase gamma subunit [Butyricicoccus pullicaecorum]|nr:sodium pump decarboxylase gamma subunit [Butyricicoccus pullicaecorum]